MTVYGTRFLPRRLADRAARLVCLAVAVTSLGIIDFFQARLGAATITAASCSRTDVLNAIGSAQSGDVVTVPAGNCTWSAPVTIGQAVVLRGAGLDSTIITSSASNQNGYLVTWSAASPATFELSGFTINGNDAVGCLYLSNGSGGSTPATGLKIHDNRFTRCRLRALTDSGMAYGAIYKNEFVDNFIDVGSIGAENLGWTAPFAYGDGNNVFVEDNLIVHTTDAARGQPLYLAQGGRMVFRYNTIRGYIDFDNWDFHGNIGMWPANRGTVGGEMYRNNTAITAGTYTTWRGFFFRGGQAVAFNNIFTSNTGNGSAYFELTEEDAWQGAFGCPCPVHDAVMNSFFWNNTMNGVEQQPFVSHPPSETLILPDIQFWLTSAGTSATRPSLCLPGTFTGTTDDDKLYRCGLNGQWALYYQPYTYPHPLRAGSGVPPSAPINIKIVR